MEDRLVRIETDLATLKAHVADMREHYATKEHVTRVSEQVAISEARLYKAMNQQTWRFVSWTTGVAAMLVSAVYFVARNVP